MGASIRPDALCRSLTVAQQQCVEIARALSVNAKLVVMDEPTAALTGREVEQLFAVIRDLKSHGIGVVYVSHRMDEVFAICDRVTVMRDGRFVAEHRTADVTRRQLIELMVGRPIESEFPKKKAAVGEVLLEAKASAAGGPCGAWT